MDYGNQIGGSMKINRTALEQQAEQHADPFEQFRQAKAEWDEACRGYADAGVRKDRATKALADAGDRASQVIQQAMQDPTAVIDANRAGLAGNGRY